MNSLDILCRVVDNYGDIGVVWRLAKALAAARPGLGIRIITDHPEVLRQLVPPIDPALPVQSHGRFTFINWDHPWEGFRQAPPRCVIEAFACGRPDFYETVLHDPDAPDPCLHVVLEYLSAEPWTAEYHLLPSLSPSPRVKKVFFMPGFISGTGGLILDREYLARRDRAWSATSPERCRRLAELGISLPVGAEAMTWLCLFSYEHDYSRLVADIAASRESGGPGTLVLVAAGRSSESVRAAANTGGAEPAPCFLPFLPQEAWDEVLVSSDLLIVRGEESLARASLSGRPFVWHAYVQEAGYQRVKVTALLEVMAPCFSGPGVEAATAGAFARYRGLVELFNERHSDSVLLPAAETWADFLRDRELLAPGFRRFAKMLENLGDTATNLLSLIDDFG